MSAIKAKNTVFSEKSNRSIVLSVMSFKKKTSYPKLMQNIVPSPRMKGNSTFNGAKYIPKRVIS